ncbi:DUF3667 domain-containing protein [Gilvibacter sediminis]|uniref:DUF3667 domain-containing protein n=1 Tax=Gilvibacter sediminis TaxID=379071 RepID=UPI00235084B2|nr:DUF3667 domain-containing protein [Gilvibacter sediminis]MDC7997274.1 DUF3667 domain-containing protein [Gilvibacter sediminis]
MEDQSTCKNCGTQTQGAYCHHCGQRSGIHKVSFSETFGDLASGLFTLEAPLWRTTKALFLSPSQLFAEYLSGQRKKYYKPVAYFILWSALFILVRSLIKFDPFKSVQADTTLNTDIQWLYDAGKLMSANINNFMFIFVLTLGGFLKIFFYKKHTFAEFVAVSFYLLCVYTLINTLFQIYLKLSGAQPNFFPALLFGAYLVYAIPAWLKGNWVLSFFKTVVVFFLASLFYLALSFGLSILIVLFF